MWDGIRAERPGEATMAPSSPPDEEK